MKLILSRKGVDSSTGGFASPIFPDGSLISIPIPDQRASLCYRDINTSFDVGRLVKQLSGGRIGGKDAVHLDPDLDREHLYRSPGWAPLFGQCGAAQSHLASHAVGAGDVFLFFGWFRSIEMYRRKWRYVPGAPDQHVIFGWMQVQTVVDVESIKSSACHRSMRYHPHCHGDFSGVNTVYRARKKLQLPNLSNVAGGGVFREYHPLRCLTAAGRSRSIWSLPVWMNPRGRESVLSYHSDNRRWIVGDDSVELRSAARGQEFVLDIDHYPAAMGWLEEVISP